MTKIKPEELNDILEKLETRGFIIANEKKGWLGKKIELNVTEKGNKEIEERVHELQGKWENMRNAAKLVNLETSTDIINNIDNIYKQSVLSYAMPPGNISFL